MGTHALQCPHIQGLRHHHPDPSCARAIGYRQIHWGGGSLASPPHASSTHHHHSCDLKRFLIWSYKHMVYGKINSCRNMIYNTHRPRSSVQHPSYGAHALLLYRPGAGPPALTLSVKRRRMGSRHGFFNHTLRRSESARHCLGSHIVQSGAPYFSVVVESSKIRERGYPQTKKLVVCESFNPQLRVQGSCP